VALAEQPITTAAVYIETYGCAFNQADSETMAGVLADAGYQLVDRPELADLVILNTCTVKDRTQAHFEHRFHAIKQAAHTGHGPQLLVAGCIPGAGKYRKQLAGVAAIGPGQVGRIADVAAAALAGFSRHLIGTERGDPSLLDRPLLPSRRSRPTLKFFPSRRGAAAPARFVKHGLRGVVCNLSGLAT
jgi:threonylcarbamoyladenosine tRNA methylthiotransferase CDKAL1